MTVRATSKQAFHVAGVRISHNQRQILTWMRDYGGGLTSAELLHRHRVANVNLWRARFSELADIGAIVSGPARLCARTGRKAFVWNLAEQPWKPRPHRMTARRRLAVAVRLLRAVRDAGLLRVPLTGEVRTFLHSEISQ